MKKAWEIEDDKFINGIPVILSEEEQTWKAAESIEIMSNMLYKMKWSSQVPGSGAKESVIIGGIQSMENMGYDVSKAEILMHQGLRALDKNDLGELIKITCNLWNMFGKMDRIKDHPYWKFKNYGDFKSYEDKVIFLPCEDVDVSNTSFKEQIRRGWLAQIIGGAYGTALEGYSSTNLQKQFGSLNRYIREPNTYNDDLTYELAFLNAFMNKGFEITSQDIALEWVALVPFGWSAEEIALKNIEAGIMPPLSGYFNNPYREWIGAQMRGAVCGMVAPGNPNMAARLAFMDGEVSHHNNGVIGEVFNAIMVSLAFTYQEVRKLVIDAISMVPNDSEYYQIINNALHSAIKHLNWESAWKAIEPDFIKYNWIHAYPNAAAEVIALWFGEGDFEATMEIVGSIGYDVDCNAAQIMTVIGIMAQEIPDKWSKPIGETVLTYCRNLKTTSITELTDWVLQAINNARKK